jgi:hypothetical protein
MDIRVFQSEIPASWGFSFQGYRQSGLTHRSDAALFPLMLQLMLMGVSALLSAASATCASSHFRQAGTRGPSRRLTMPSADCSRYS